MMWPDSPSGMVAVPMMRARLGTLSGKRCTTALLVEVLDHGSRPVNGPPLKSMEVASERLHTPCDVAVLNSAAAKRHQGGSESPCACARMENSTPLKASRACGETKLTMSVSAPAFELQPK